MHRSALTACFLLIAATAFAQSPGQPPASPQPPAQGRGEGRGGGQGRGGGPRGPAQVPFDDHEGFKQIFDGTTLKDWDGDPAFW
jgi:hypothetical protein